MVLKLISGMVKDVVRHVYGSIKRYGWKAEMMGRPNLYCRR